MSEDVISVSSTITVTHQQRTEYDGAPHRLCFGDITIKQFGDTPRRCKMLIREGTPGRPAKLIHIEINPHDDPAKWVVAKG